jgi:hypothetical protein
MVGWLINWKGCGRSDCGLAWGTISAFGLRNWELWKTSGTIDVLWPIFELGTSQTQVGSCRLNQPDWSRKYQRLRTWFLQDWKDFSSRIKLYHKWLICDLLMHQYDTVPGLMILFMISQEARTPLILLKVTFSQLLALKTGQQIIQHSPNCYMCALKTTASSSAVVAGRVAFGCCCPNNENRPRADNLCHPHFFRVTYQHLYSDDILICS